MKQDNLQEIKVTEELHNTKIKNIVDKLKELFGVDVLGSVGFYYYYLFSLFFFFRMSFLFLFVCLFINLFIYLFVFNEIFNIFHVSICYTIRILLEDWIFWDNKGIYKGL